MPRANRTFLPGYVWHITHRCHKKEFLLKFAKDRERWLYWLFEAKKRYGLCILNYVVTSNHIHLLVKDTGKKVIPHSMQLIAGRTAQEYNTRKSRKGAYWEDRYHATAVQTDNYLLRCMTYIDLNMVRAGVVDHPRDWRHGGYAEIQNPPERYRLIDLPELMSLTGVNEIGKLQEYHRIWMEIQLRSNTVRNDSWTTSVAVGSETFVKEIRHLLGHKVKARRVIEDLDKYVLKEPTTNYSVVFGL